MIERKHVTIKNAGMGLRQKPKKKKKKKVYGNYKTK